MARTIQLEDGEVISAKDGQYFYLQCCRCGLRHRIDVKGDTRLKITGDDKLNALAEHLRKYG